MELIKFEKEIYSFTLFKNIYNYTIVHHKKICSFQWDIFLEEIFEEEKKKLTNSIYMFIQERYFYELSNIHNVEKYWTFLHKHNESKKNPSKKTTQTFDIKGYQILDKSDIIKETLKNHSLPEESKIKDKLEMYDTSSIIKKINENIIIYDRGIIFRKNITNFEKYLFLYSRENKNIYHTQWSDNIYSELKKLYTSWNITAEKFIEEWRETNYHSILMLRKIWIEQIEKIHQENGPSTLVNISKPEKFVDFDLKIEIIFDMHRTSIAEDIKLDDLINDINFIDDINRKNKSENKINISSTKKNIISNPNPKKVNESKYRSKMKNRNIIESINEDKINTSSTKKSNNLNINRDGSLFVFDPEKIYKYKSNISKNISNDKESISNNDSLYEIMIESKTDVYIKRNKSELFIIFNDFDIKNLSFDTNKIKIRFVSKYETNITYKKYCIKIKSSDIIVENINNNTCIYNIITKETYMENVEKLINKHKNNIELLSDIEKNDKSALFNYELMDEKLNNNNIYLLLPQNNDMYNIIENIVIYMYNYNKNYNLLRKDGNKIILMLDLFKIITQIIYSMKSSSKIKQIQY